ncbi:MAG: hypothetical protein AAGC44_14980, partial [Planctomycetota bacterium]
DASVQFGRVVGVMGVDVDLPIIAEDLGSRKTEQAPYSACGLITMRITGVFCWRFCHAPLSGREGELRHCQKAGQWL